MAKDLKDIQNYLLLYGYDDVDIFEVDEELLSLMKELIDLDVPEISGVDIPYMTKKTFRESGKAFYASKLLLHDVGLLTDKKLINMIKTGNYSTVEQLVNAYNGAAEFVNPFKIPVSYTDDSLFAGILETQILVTEDPKSFSNILSKINVYFNKIIMAKKLTKISMSCYIHEIMHSQLESQKGIIKNFYNGEVLSIFMELLAAYEKKDISYYVILINRLNSVLFNFNKMFLYQTGENDENYKIYDFCMSGKYLVSVLKAFNLLNLYLNSCYNEKKDILINIQAVLDGARYLEEMLERYDVTYDSSINSNIVKSLLLR